MPAECLGRHYDRFGRLVRVAEPAGAGGAVVSTDYTYDMLGHLTQIAQGTSQARSYTYDGRGFLKSETIPERGTTGNGTLYNCSFDALGNPWKSRETPCTQGSSLGIAITLDYATRLTSVSEEGGNQLKQLVYEAGTGRLLTAKSFNRSTEAGWNPLQVDDTYAYNGIAGAVSGKTTTVYANGIPQETFTTSVTTDRAGQIQSLGYPSCTGGFCSAQQPGSRTVDYRYANGALSRIPGFVDTPITYHANGMVSEIRHSNQMRQLVTIDTATMMARPKRLQVLDKFGGTIHDSGDFQYDGAGNIKAMGTDRRYRYDAVSRLVDSRETVDSVIHQQAPTYDAYGNIQALTTGPLSAPQTLMTPTSASTNRLTSFGTTYDWMGNMTRWVSGPAYDYDRLNRMRRFRASTLPGSEEWVFAYTADDERILSKRVVGGTDEIWTLRGPSGQVLREMRPNVSVHQLKDYVWTGRTMVARIERTPAGGKPPYTEETIHVATDHLDTPRWFTDSSGTELNSRHFYPFGKEITAEAGSDRYQFTGHERDGWSTSSPNDDLDYMHARHYNPQLGRFLQVDPLGGIPGRPQSLNRYAYVEGNPIGFVDPVGLMRNNCRLVVQYELVWSYGHFGEPLGADIQVRGTYLYCQGGGDGVDNVGGNEDGPPRDGTPNGGPTPPTPPGPTPTPKPPPKLPVHMQNDPWTAALLEAMRRPNCIQKGPPLTFSVSGGGAFGFHFSFDLESGDLSTALGTGADLGAAISYGGTMFGQGSSGNWGELNLSLAGGFGPGGFLDISGGPFHPTSVSGGLGLGFNFGWSVTTPIPPLSGNLYDSLGIRRITDRPCV